MKLTQKIVVIGELASRLGVSIPTIRRFLQASRKGQGNLPLPISSPGCKCRWLDSDIEAYLATKFESSPASISTFRQASRDKKAFELRQRLADQVLEKHKTKKGKN